MTVTTEEYQKPLWVQIEERLDQLESVDPSSAGVEKAVSYLAGSLDESGFNVSRHAGNMLRLRLALKDKIQVGGSLWSEFQEKLHQLTLDDVVDTYKATMKMSLDMSERWPSFADSAKRADVQHYVAATKLDLLVDKAKSLNESKGVRLLIEENVEKETVMARLEVSEAAYDQVLADLEAERAKRAEVKGLLKEVADKSKADMIRHLIDHDVNDDLMIELANVSAEEVAEARKAMEEELKERQRKAEEEAARKKAEAEGPKLEEISAEDMLEYIEGIREILEFSDKETEIRQMCEQSSIPKCLQDIAVNDPDKLDELEEQAEG